MSDDPIKELSLLERHSLKMLRCLEDYLSTKSPTEKLASAKRLASLLEELISNSQDAALTILQASMDQMARSALSTALGAGAEAASIEELGLEGQLRQTLFPQEELDPQDQLCAIIDPLLLNGNTTEAVERVAELTGWSLDDSAVVVRGRQEQLISHYNEQAKFGQPHEGVSPVEETEESSDEPPTQGEE